MILQINDKSFNIGTINLSRQWDIEEKYRVTTESGTKLREVRGVYKKYTLNLRNIDDTTYNDLIEELTNGADVSTKPKSIQTSVIIPPQIFLASNSKDKLSQWCILPIVLTSSSDTLEKKASNVTVPSLP